MWFKNLRFFRLQPEWQCSAQELESLLEKQQFHPGGKLDMQSMGWVPVREGGGLVHAVNGQYLLSLRSEKKLLPNTVINQFAKAKSQEIEEQQGFRPGRKQLKEIKEQVRDELLPKAFSIFKDTYVWLDPVNKWLVIDAAAVAKSDEVIGLLAKALTPFPVLPVYTETAPATAMNNWLISNEPPAGFTVDQDAELRSTNESNAIVRYVRHSIDPSDVRKHIEQGKQCTRLALTWAERVSFILTDTLEIKRVAPLDILKEHESLSAQDEEEQFDAEFALMAGELSYMLNDLIAELGGEKSS